MNVEFGPVINVLDFAAPASFRVFGSAVQRVDPPFPIQDIAVKHLSGAG